MRVLSFTSLFPNAVQPILGVFVYQRLAHVAKGNSNLIHVVAPVPYFPSCLKGLRWSRIAEVPRREKIGSLVVYHPRYLLLPGISMPLHGWLMYAGSRRLVQSLHERIKFDCIDAHYVYPDGFAAVLLGRLLNLPVFVSARGTDINQFPSFPTIRPLIKWTLREATGIIAVSHALKAAMVQLGVPAEKISVIGNGVDVQRFGLLERTEARQSLGLRKDVEALISVASLVPAKGHRSLISAFGQIASQHPKLNLYLIGDGPLHSELEGLIQEKSLVGRVSLVGSKRNEELKLWYNAANLSCLVSVREGWPNVLLESMACGTPVLATDVGGVREVILSEEFGVIVKQEVDAIAQGLQFALHKDWNRETMADYAKSRTWDVVAAEVENYFTAHL